MSDLRRAAEAVLDELDEMGRLYTDDPSIESLRAALQSERDAPAIDREKVANAISKYTLSPMWRCEQAADAILAHIGGVK